MKRVKEDSMIRKGLCAVGFIYFLVKPRGWELPHANIFLKSFTKLSPSFYRFGSLNCHIPNNEIIPTSQNLKFDKDSRVTIIYDSVFVFLIM